jgi:RNA polymerase sigma-70 factor (ECF subfamily)
LGFFLDVDDDGSANPSTLRYGMVQVAPTPLAVSPANAGVAATMLDFSSVFSGHIHYVWSSLRRLGVHARDLEDVAHEVFLRIHAQLPQRDPEKPIRPWLFGVALGVAANYRRLARHRLNLSIEPPEVQDSQPDPDERLLMLERRQMVHTALQQVPLVHRAVLILHDMDEVAIPEISAALAIGVNTAYSRLRLGREAFRTALEQLLARGGSQ